MARFQQGTSNIVLEGIKDGTDNNTAATRGYVNSFMSHGSARDLIVVDTVAARTALTGVAVDTIIYVTGTREWTRVTAVDNTGVITTQDTISLVEYVELPTVASGNSVNVAEGDIVRDATKIYVATSSAQNLNEGSTIPTAWIDLTDNTDTTYTFSNTSNSGTTLGVNLVETAGVVSGTVDGSDLHSIVEGTWRSAADSAARDALTDLTVGDFIYVEDTSSLVRVDTVQGSTNTLNASTVVNLGVVQLGTTAVRVEPNVIAVDATANRVYLNTNTVAATGVTASNAGTNLTLLNGTASGSTTYTGGTGITVDNVNDTISITANGVTADELNVSGDGTSGQVLTSDGDGSFSWSADVDTTYGPFTRTMDGLVPNPTTTTEVRYLREDGTWEIPPDNTDHTTYTIDAVDNGADVNLNLIAAGSTSGTDTVMITAGTAITLDSVTTGGFTINSSDTTYSAGTGLEISAANQISISEDGVTASLLNVAGNGNSGQVLSSDGDGSFSWVNQTGGGGGGGGADNDDTVVPTWDANEIANYERGQLVYFSGSVYYLNDGTVGSLDPAQNSDWIDIGPADTSGFQPTLTQAQLNVINANPFTTARQNEVIANSLKVSNVTTNLGYTASSTNGIVTSSDGTNATIPTATTTNAGLLTPAEKGEIAANNLKVTNATHTGDVTGSTALTITAGAVGADELDVSGDGTMGQFLTSDGDGSFSWTTATTGSGGITSVNTDRVANSGAGGTLKGTGTSASPLSVASLPEWSETAAYLDGDVVIDPTALGLFQARMDIAAGDVTTPVPNVIDISFGNVGANVGVYSVLFSNGNQFTPVANTVYTIAIGGGYNVDFTVMGSDINTTILNSWIIAPADTTLKAGSHPGGLRSPTSDVAITFGATVTNPRPSLDDGPSGRWDIISAPAIDDPLRYDLHTGQEIRWTESGVGYVGITQFVNTQPTTLGPNDTTVSGTTLTIRNLPTTLAQTFVDATRVVTHIDDLAAYRIFDTTTTTPADITAGRVIATVIAQIGDTGQITPTTIEGLVDGVNTSVAAMTVKVDGAVATDSTISGDGIAQATGLSVSRLKVWSSATTYAEGDMVVDDFDYQIYKASTGIPGMPTIPTLATVSRVSYAVFSGVSTPRYLVEFAGTNPTVTLNETYRFDVVFSGLTTSFTILGSDISTTTLTGFWVIDPATAPSFILRDGTSNPINQGQVTTNISISVGTAAANARPGLDGARWDEVSSTPIDYNARYSTARGEALRWSEGSTVYNGSIERIVFESILAANSSVAGTGAGVRYTVSGLQPGDVATMVAADRVSLTSGLDAQRTIGIATAGATSDEVIFQGTCIQTDEIQITDPAIVGAGILARGPLDLTASFAAVTILHEPGVLIEDFHSVADMAARMALTTSDVKFGDVVYQQDNDTSWEVTHATAAVANFLNFTWGSNSLSNDALLLHFSATTPTPVSANTYTLVAGGDTWTFSGSNVQTRMVAGSIEWTIPNGSVSGSSNRMALRRAGTLTSFDGTIDFEQINLLNDVDDLANQWPGTFTADFTVTQGEFWVRDARVFTCISTRNITSSNHALFGPGSNSAVWSELTNEHVIRTWPASYNNSEQFILRKDEIYQTSTGELYLSIIVDSLGNGISANAVAVDSSADFTTFTPSDSSSFWRRIDGAGGGSGTSNAAIINTSGVASLATGITGEEIRDLIGALDPTDFTLHRQDEDLILTIDGSTTFTVDMQDIRQGPTLPTRAHNNEVFWLNAASGGRHAGLYRYDASISFWFPADAAFGDVTINSLEVDRRLTIPSHGNDLTVVDANEAASIGDLLQEGRDIRNSLGPDVTVHGDLEEEPDTQAVYVQSIELTGDFSDETNGTFRHVRQTPVVSNYPTLPTANATRTALVLAAFPDAPLMGRVGLNGTHRIDQYMPTANAGRIGGTIPLERAISGTDGYQLNEDFLENGGIADNTSDPAIVDPNARFLLGQDNGELIEHDPAAGTFTSPTDGLIIGMAFKADQIDDTHTGQLPIWTMNFQARNQSDTRNVGMFLEGAASTGTTNIGQPISVASFGGLARLDIAFSDTPEPAHDQRQYTLTTNNGTVINFRANDNNGNHITVDTGFTGDRIWRIPAALVTNFPAANNTSLGEFRDTVTSLTTTTPSDYHIRIKTGTGNNSLINDEDGLIEIVADTSYYLVSHLSVVTNSSNENRLSLITYLYDWDADAGSWALLSSSLGHATTLTGFNVNVLSSTEAIDVINPEIRIGLAEYQNNASTYNNNLTMSKIFIAKAEAAVSANTALALVNSSDPFNGLAQSNSTDGFEFTRLNHVDIPYSDYDPVAGTILPTADWLIPDTSATDAAAFRTAIGSTNWVPVSEVMSADGNIRGFATLPTQGNNVATSSDATDHHLWIHPTGSGYVDPVKSVSPLTAGPTKDGVPNNTGINASLTAPQGPISSIDYFTTTGLDGASAISYLPTSVWNRNLFLDSDDSGVARIWATPLSAAESVSDDLGTIGTDGGGRLYVPQYRTDLRAAQTPSQGPLGRQDFDPNTHFLLGRFLSGGSRRIYYTVGGFDPATGLMTGIARVDSPIAGTSSGTPPTGINTELYVQDPSDQMLRSFNISLERFASFVFEVGAPQNVLEDTTGAGGASRRGDVLPFGMFGMLDLFFGTEGTAVGSGESEYIPYDRRGATHYWYPSREMDGQLGVWQNYIGDNAPTDGQWRLALLG